MAMQRLVIVRRNEFATFARLSQTFANEPNVRLVWDRRLRDRRQSTAPTPVDRRRRDRRASPTTTWGPDDYLLLTIAQDDALALPSGRAPRAGESMASGQSMLSEDLRRDVEAAAASDLSVLISGGESVMRKSLAHRIHRQSLKSDGRFVIVDPDTFTTHFARADAPGRAGGDIASGTLLIEEVADWTLPQQTQLLHFLEWINGCGRNGAAHVRPARLISGTSHWLMDRISTNQFREDLFYRLNVIHLVLSQTAPFAL